MPFKVRVSVIMNHRVNERSVIFYEEMVGGRERVIRQQMRSGCCEGVEGRQGCEDILVEWL